MKMFKTTKDPFKKAEALGDLTTMPVMETMNQAQEPQKKPVVSNPEEFRTAQWEAQHDGTGYIEVTEELYKFIIKNNPTESFTYGNPGIRVFKEGTREKILSEEKKSAY